MNVVLAVHKRFFSNKKEQFKIHGLKRSNSFSYPSSVKNSY